MTRVLALGFALALVLAAGSGMAAEARHRHGFYRTYNAAYPYPAYTAARPWNAANYNRYLVPGDEGPFAARIAQLRALSANNPNPQVRQVYAQEIFKLRAMQRRGY